jgi:predicted nuclease of predicted toxin-antitoxin system
VRFKVDENLPQEVVDLLSKAGHDALSVVDEGLGGEKDPRIFSVCRHEALVLVTLDLDFSNIHEYPPADSAGLLILRLPKQDKPTVLAVMDRLLAVLNSSSLEKALWIVEEERIRIRT